MHIEKCDNRTYSLCFSFVGTLILMINSTKIRYNNRYWQGDYKHTAQRANTSDNFSGYGLRYHVAIAVNGKRENISNMGYIALVVQIRSAVANNYPSVVIVTMVYQNAAGIEVKFVTRTFFSA